MNPNLQPRSGQKGGAIIVYLVVALIVMATLATLCSYVIHNIQMSSRRQDMVSAYQFAQGGAALASRDVEIAFTNTGAFLDNLTSSPTAPYALNSALSTPTVSVYERSITSPFTNQTVALQLSVTNAPILNQVKVLATAKVGKVTQSVQAYLDVQFAYPGAILSTHKGTTADGVSKSTAQAGNAVITGGSSGITKVDGGVMANGKANVGQGATVTVISELLYGTANQIPDYTNPGSDMQLFDFNRFTAVADKSGNHFTNLTHFTTYAATQTLEGVVVVDIPKGDKGTLDEKKFPKGINVRGTLVFKFGPGWNPTDKIVNTASMNINAANMNGFVASDPATYPSGYPPLYTNPAKDPVNIKLEPAFPSFTAADDLPALMYNNAILDIHGDANVCGVVYSPCFMEIENKQDGQIQYFRGALIGGGGILFENHRNATSIVSYDGAALDNLATVNNVGKSVKMVFQNNPYAERR